MRLTVNLDPDLYGLARSLAREADCSVSAAVNQLLRRSLTGAGQGGPATARPSKRNGFVVSKGRVVVTADTVRRVEAEDDEA